MQEYTKDEILSTIENYEPVTTANSSSGLIRYSDDKWIYINQFTRYSHDKWITKIAFTENVEANTEYSRRNIKVPYILNELFKSYLNNYKVR